jgi:F-type H+-transporting ATPase subunit b
MTIIAASEDLQHLLPKPAEAIVGAICFLIIFIFFWKWALPKINKILDDRRDQIVGEMERAEQQRREADKLLEDYRAQLAGARDDANRVIEEARKTAEQLRIDLSAKAEKDAQALVARAQEEIRAERDRVFQELKATVGAMSVELAGRVVGESLDAKRHEQLVDQYIDQVAGLGNGDGS